MSDSIMSVNTSGQDNFVYHGELGRNKILGLLNPCYLDWQFMLDNRAPKRKLRECEMVSGTEEFISKNGKRLSHDNYDLYISDYVWMLCNYQCPYCLTDSPEYTKSEGFYVKWEDKLNWLKYVSSECSDRGLTYYYRIFGGEPTIYPGIENLLSYINQDKACTVANMSTNLHVKSKIDFIAENISPEKLSIYAAVHPSDPKFDWENFKTNLMKLFEANFSIFLIGVNVKINIDSLHKYSLEVEKLTGNPISIFHNLRKDKYDD